MPRGAHLKLYQFKPGQSGNPGGRRSGRSLTSYLRDGLDEVTEGGRDARELIAERLIDLALSGDRQAIRDVFDRVDGKVAGAISEEQSTPAVADVVAEMIAAAKAYDRDRESDAAYAEVQHDPAD